MLLNDNLQFMNCKILYYNFSFASFHRNNLAFGICNKSQAREARIYVAERDLLFFNMHAVLLRDFCDITEHKKVLILQKKNNSVEVGR